MRNSKRWSIAAISCFAFASHVGAQSTPEAKAAEALINTTTKEAVGAATDAMSNYKKDKVGEFDKYTAKNLQQGLHANEAITSGEVGYVLGCTMAKKLLDLKVCAELEQQEIARRDAARNSLAGRIILNDMERVRRERLEHETASVSMIGTRAAALGCATALGTTLAEGERKELTRQAEVDRQLEQYAAPIAESEIGTQSAASASAAVTGKTYDTAVMAEQARVADERAAASSNYNMIRRPAHQQTCSGIDEAKDKVADILAKAKASAAATPITPTDFGLGNRTDQMLSNARTGAERAMNEAASQMAARAQAQAQVQAQATSQQSNDNGCPAHFGGHCGPNPNAAALAARQESWNASTQPSTPQCPPGKTYRAPPPGVPNLNAEAFGCK